MICYLDPACTLELSKTWDDHLRAWVWRHGDDDLFIPAMTKSYDRWLEEVDGWLSSLHREDRDR